MAEIVNYDAIGNEYEVTWMWIAQTRRKMSSAAGGSDSIAETSEVVDFRI